MAKVYFLKSELGQVTPFAPLADKNGIELVPIEGLAEIPPSEMAVLPWKQLSVDSSLSSVVLYSELAKLTDEEKANLKKLCSKSNVFGLIDTTCDPEFHAPLFRSIDIKLKERNRMVRLAQMSEELGELTEQMDREITRVKKIHEKLIPVRNEELKGVKVFSKYAAGETTGGDFFDFYQDGNSLFFILTASTSYLMSSTIISRLELLKSAALTDKSIKEMVAGILEDADTLGIKDRNGRNALDLLTIKIDLISMSVEGYRFGGGDIVSPNEAPKLPSINKRDIAFLDEAYFNFGMQQSDKLIFLSSGFRHNTDGVINGTALQEFVRKELANPPKELLNELFFQLKKDRETDFLKHDASAIYIEVNRNGIFKV